MTITRPQIRRQVLDFKPWRNCGYFTLTAADARSLTATTFGQGGDSLAKFSNRFLYTPASAAVDVLRKVQRFDPLNRKVFHEGPDYGANPAVAAVVEVWPYDPLDVVNTAVSRALTRRVFSLQRTDIVCDGSSVYTIGTVPFDTLSTMTDPDDQILDIEQVQGTAGNDELVTPWDTDGKGYYGEVDATDGTLKVRFNRTPQGTIRVIWKQPYADLTDETTTSTAPLMYAARATQLEIFMILEERAINHAESDAQYGEMKKSVEERLHHEESIALGARYAFHKKRRRVARVFRPAPTVGLRGPGYSTPSRW